jgi:hypothetical protein
MPVGTDKIAMCRPDVFHKSTEGFYVDNVDRPASPLRVYHKPA